MGARSEKRALRMPVEQMIEQGAGRRLATLIEPQSGCYRIEIRAPHPLDPARPGGQRHVAGRGASDQRQVAIQLGTAMPERRTEHAERAGMGVDQTAAHETRGGQAEVRCCRFGQGTERCADRAGARRHRAAGPQVVEPGDRQEVVLPAGLLVGEVGPLAGQGAAGARIRAACLKGQEVREVEDPPIAQPGLGARALQPHQLGDLHLGRHRAAERVQHGVAARRAATGFGDRPVVEPGDHVPAILVAGRHAGRPVRLVQGDQRAGGIERDAGDRLPADTGDGERVADRGRDRRPDVVRALLGVVWLRPVQRDRSLGPGEHAAAGIEHASARAAGADIHGDHGRIPHGQLPDLAPLATLLRSEFARLRAAAQRRWGRREPEPNRIRQVRACPTSVDTAPGPNPFLAASPQPAEHGPKGRRAGGTGQKGVRNVLGASSPESE